MNKSLVYRASCSIKPSVLLATVLLFTGFSLEAQTSDSIAAPAVTAAPARQFRNTIKLNSTSWVLYDAAFQLVYERTISKYQSINIFGGYNEFPVDISLDLDNTAFSGEAKRSGYSVGADYRFYLAKENKYEAPHGIYLAPSVSYFGFNSERTLTHTDSGGANQSASLHSKIDFLNIGGALGCQFVLGKRFVIDAVLIAPSITHYHFTAKLDGKINGLDLNETQQKVVDAIKGKLPMLNEVSKDREVDKSGTEKFWAFGYRCSISLGFRF
jgi:hypothetical protein